MPTRSRSDLEPLWLAVIASLHGSARSPTLTGKLAVATAFHRVYPCDLTSSLAVRNQGATLFDSRDSWLYITRATSPTSIDSRAPITKSQAQIYLIPVRGSTPDPIYISQAPTRRVLILPPRGIPSRHMGRSSGESDCCYESRLLEGLGLYEDDDRSPGQNTGRLYRTSSTTAAVCEHSSRPVPRYATCTHVGCCPVDNSCPGLSSSPRNGFLVWWTSSEEGALKPGGSSARYCSVSSDSPTWFTYCRQCVAMMGRAIIYLCYCLDSYCLYVVFLRLF